MPMSSAARCRMQAFGSFTFSGSYHFSLFFFSEPFFSSLDLFINCIHQNIPLNFFEDSSQIISQSSPLGLAQPNKLQGPLTQPAFPSWDLTNIYSELPAYLQICDVQSGYYVFQGGSVQPIFLSFFYYISIFLSPHLRIFFFTDPYRESRMEEREREKH